MIITQREAVASAGVGGLALAAAFPPWSAPWLAPIGVCAYFLAVRGGGVRAGSVTGYIFGLTFFGPTLWWLTASIAPAAWAAIVVVQAGWLALLGAAVAHGHCAVAVQQQHGHRLADDVGAADHHRMASTEIAKLGLEKVQAAERGAGHQRRRIADR